MREILEPKVKLINHTPNPEEHIYIAARLCYAAMDIEDIGKDVTPEDMKKLLKFLNKARHLSAFEHASFTFAIEDISRVLTHQLVRHRLASYNQQSHRYVKMDRDIAIIIPPSVQDIPEMREKYIALANQEIEFYQDMVDAGIPEEDARYIVGHGIETKIIVTMNARELMHFFNHRCCRRAQWEIQNLAWKMYKLGLAVAPEIFSLSGPPCLNGKCPEGKMTCGEPYIEEMVKELLDNERI